MSDPFVAEIRVFPFNFAPKGWAFCDGQLLPLTQNTALYSLLGTYYGGNGKDNFALPDLQGCSPMHPGQGPATSERYLGEQGGEQSVTLLQTEMPVHNHAVQAANFPGDVQTPSATVALARSGGGNAYQATTSTPAAMAPDSLPFAGSSTPHNNMQPYLTLNFNIALQGVYPPRQ